MARDIIKYITYAPKTESTWNTPEEKKQEKERVIEHASKEMVKSLIKRNKKTLKFDYRGIYYNGKLGLIIIGRIPENAQEENYKDYTTLFDIDTASDPENIKEIIKEYLKENNLGGVIFKLTEEGTKPKGLYDQLHRQLKEGESELFFSGAIDNITSKYDWIKTALDIELEPDDELINGTYTIEYSEAGDEVTGLLHITALSKQGILYTAQGKMIGDKSSEAESFTDKSSNKIKLVSDSKSLKPFQWDWETRTPKDIAEKVQDFVGDNKKFTYSESLLGDELDKVKAFLHLDTDEFVNGNYVVSFDLSEEDKLSYKGIIVLEHKDGSKKIYSEKLQSVDVTNEETTLFNTTLGNIPAPTKPPIDIKKLTTPKRLFDALDSHTYGGLYLGSGTVQGQQDTEAFFDSLQIDKAALLGEGVIDPFIRATYHYYYERQEGTDTLDYNIEVLFETNSGERILTTFKYDDAEKDQDNLDNREYKFLRYKKLSKPSIDPTLGRSLKSADLAMMFKPYDLDVDEEVNITGAKIDHIVIQSLPLEIQGELKDAVNEPIAMLYDLTFAFKDNKEKLSSAIKLMFINKDGSKVTFTAEYIEAPVDDFSYDNLQNQTVVKTENTGNSGNTGSTNDGKNILDYKHQVFDENKPLDIKTRYTPYIKTGTKEAYLEGVVVDSEVLMRFKDKYSIQVSEGSFDPLAVLYEISFKDNENDTIDFKELLHFVLEDGRQLLITNTLDTVSVTENTAEMNISTRLIPAQVSKEFFEKLKEKVEKIEKTTNIAEEKRLTESISVGGEVLLETYKGELKNGPKKYYSLNVGHNLGHHITERMSGAGIFSSSLDTSKYNVFRRDGGLFLPMDLYKRSLNGDGLFYGRALDRFAKDLNGANNIRTQDAFRFDTDTGFPELNVVGTSGTLDIHELLFAAMIPNGGSIAMLDPQELGIGVAGKEIIPPMSDGVSYESLYIRNAAESLQEFAIFKVTFTDKEKFKKLMETIYLEEAGKCFGMVYNEKARGSVTGELHPNLGPTNSYPIHKTTFGAIVGSNDKRNKLGIQYLGASNGNRTNDLSKIADLYKSSFLALISDTKAFKHPRTIGGTPYLFAEGSKDEEKNPLGIVGVVFNQTEVHNMTGYYVKEYVNQEILPNLGLTESNLTAELVEFGYEKQDRHPGEENDSPIIVITFDISSNDTKIGRIKMRQTMEVVKQYYVRTTIDLGTIT